jgi:uncharacterized membrane protein HdeD (DUF308 family)
MDENNIPQTANEKNSLALSGLLMALVGVICSFMPGWRIFALVISIAGLIICLLTMNKAKKTGLKKAIPLWGISSAAISISISLLFLYHDNKFRKEHEEINKRLEFTDSLSKKMNPPVIAE